LVRERAGLNVLFIDDAGFLTVVGYPVILSFTICTIPPRLLLLNASSVVDFHIRHADVACY
jgi:hypothetical protein